jgi:hypothetical protein
MKKTIYTLITLVLSVQGIAQTIPLDLSNNANNSFTQTIKPQTIKSIFLENKLADESKIYKIYVKKETIEIPPFSINSFQKATRMKTCDSINNKIDSLVKAAKNESDIPKLVKDLNKEIEEIKKIKSNDYKDLLLLIANQRINLTKDTCKLTEPIVIENGDMVTITVTRDTITWTYILKTEQVSHWKTYYGFSYVFPSVLTKFDNYYAKQDTGSSYLITKSNQSTKYQLKNITPTIMLSYLFFKNQNAQIKIGFTAGFQVDLNTPSALFCPSLIIGDNISLNLGIAVIQKNALKGQYKLDQRINGNLEFDQLHDKVWTYDIFFSVAFRFDKNPFKKEETKNTSNSKE